MNKICDNCIHQETNYKGGVMCDKSGIANGEPGYGTFKVGSNCIYDSDLIDSYTPIPNDGVCDNLKSMSALNERLDLKMMKLRDDNLDLRDRLVKIG